MARTNIVIDEALIAEAMKRTGIRTKREVVTEALRALVNFERRREALEYRGKLQWEGDLDAMRRD